VCSYRFSQICSSRCKYEFMQLASYCVSVSAKSATADAARAAKHLLKRGAYTARPSGARVPLDNVGWRVGGGLRASLREFTGIPERSIHDGCRPVYQVGHRIVRIDREVWRSIQVMQWVSADSSHGHCNAEKLDEDRPSLTPAAV
jgi:hypothetical protein